MTEIRAPGLPGNEDQKDEALDFVYAYFKECYHLADWVEKSGYRSKAEVRKFRDANVPMGLCRDIANGLKHFELDKSGKPSVDPLWSTATVVTGGVTIMGGHRGRSRIIGPPPTVRWVVRAAGTDHDMFQLADECLALWKTFLGF